MRLDVFLFKKNYFKSRQRAKTVIENGEVSINGAIVTKPSYDIDENLEYEIIINDSCPYVSRGGLKLEGIIQHSGTVLKDTICIDIGASTGGFTDCLLKHGAKKVYAIDSGTSQLDTGIKNDNRVISIEGYNARNINLDDIGEYVDIITIDVSFISQTIILPNAIKLLADNGKYICLIKPQFELSRDKIGKGGIVKDKKTMLMAVQRVLECARLSSLICTSFIKSPIDGGDGNVEFLAVFERYGKEITVEAIKNKVLHS